MWRAIHPSWFRCRLAALGCILVGLPGLFFASPILAEPQGAELHLRIDLSDREDWRVDWWQEGDALPRATGWQVEPFLSEGLARLQRLWPEGPRQAALYQHSQASLPIDDSQPAEIAASPRATFRLRPVAPGQGLDQSFAFPAQTAGLLRVEIIGLTPETMLDFSGLELSAEPVPGEAIRLHGRFKVATPAMSGFASPLRLTLSSHRDHAALGRAILAPFGIAGPQTAHPASAPPDRAALLGLIRFFGSEAHGGFEPQLGRSIAEAGPLRAEDDRMPGPLDRAVAMAREMARRGWETRLVLSNRRHVPGLPVAPAFLFDTVLVEAVQAGLLIDPVNGLLLDAEAPHLELGGKAALVLDGEKILLRNFRPLRPADNHIVVRAQLSIDHSGRTEGQSLTEARGAAKPLLAQLLQRLGESPGRPQEMAQKQGIAGTLRLGFAEDDETRIRQHLDFQLAALPGGAMLPRIRASIGPRLFRAPLANLMPVLRDRADGPVACHPLRLEHSLVLHLPDARSLLDVPPDLRVEGPNGFYDARYRVGPGHMHVERRLEFDPPGPLCSTDLVREMAPVLRAAGRDLDRALNFRRSP